MAWCIFTTRIPTYICSTLSEHFTFNNKHVFIIKKKLVQKFKFPRKNMKNDLKKQYFFFIDGYNFFIYNHISK